MIESQKYQENMKNKCVLLKLKWQFFIYLLTMNNNSPNISSGLKKDFSMV